MTQACVAAKRMRKARMCCGGVLAVCTGSDAADLGSRAFAGSLSFVFHVSSVLTFLLRCSANALPAVVAALASQL